MRGLEPNQALADKYISTLKAKMDGYERILSKQKYLAGDVRFSHSIVWIHF
jgi:glutathione S-transferase